MSHAVFICGKKNCVQLQLELPKHTLEAFKELSKKPKETRTPKEIMEAILMGAANGTIKLHREEG